MDSPPRIVPFAIQVADALRSKLESGQWSEHLPAELVLAKHFHVGRSTLRAAIDILVREGRLRTSRGRRAEILPQPIMDHPAHQQQTIGILSPSFSESGPYQFHLYRQLSHLGFHVEAHTGSRFYGKKPGKSLDELVRTNLVNCWLLLHSTAELQQWFFRRRVPAIIDGTAYDGIRLPAIDVDYRAICRHAVGLLLGHGHRRIALLIPRSRAGGVQHCELGFHEGMQACTSADALPRIVSSTSLTEEIRIAVDRLLSGQHPPTAIIVEQPMDSLTVLTHLMNRGLHIPRDLSLIALSDAPAMKHLIPRIARYSFTLDVYARQLTQLVAKMIRKETLPAEQRFILPDYVKGDSLGPCPKA